MSTLPNFVSIDTIYGPLIVNRHGHFHAEVLVKTGSAHIHDEIEKIRAILSALPAGGS